MINFSQEKLRDELTLKHSQEKFVWQTDLMLSHVLEIKELK